MSRPRQRTLDHNSVAAPTNDLEEHYNQTEDGPIPVRLRVETDLEITA